uniref:Uncharacterized protein n=1 Tax=Anguilla anguilla TaxID=7936 RepID=A0A0E9TZF9_ANGAN
MLSQGQNHPKKNSRVSHS